MNDFGVITLEEIALPIACSIIKKKRGEALSNYFYFGFLKFDLLNFQAMDKILD